MLSPVSNTEDLLNNPQLKARNYWVEVDHSELGTAITYPGAFFKSSGFCPGIRRRAPLIGEHNKEIYQEELGLSSEEVSLLKQSGVI